MKDYMAYAVAAVVTLALSTYLTHFTLSNSSESDMALDSREAISADDIRRATEQAWEDFDAERRAEAHRELPVALRPLQQDLDDLAQRQQEINDRIDGILSGKLSSGNMAEKLTLPDSERVDELVAQAIVQINDEQTRKREERRRKEREARSQRRRERTLKRLTESLQLNGEQAGQVENLLVQLDNSMNTLREKMRSSRGEDRRMDWRKMGEEMARMRSETEKQFKEILNADQLATLEGLAKEDPSAGIIGRSPFSGRRFGRNAGSGSGGGRGRRGQR